MQTLDQFLSSLPEDLSPEARAEQITEFAKQQDQRARDQQSANQQGVNKLKENQKKLLEESKKVAANSDYIFELYETNPEMAEQIVETFGNGITVDDLKNKKKPAGWSSNNNDEDRDTKMARYENKKAVVQAKDQFVKSVWFTDEEAATFENELNEIGWDLSKLTVDSFKKIAMGIAFTMGKNLSSDPDIFKAKHNVIPEGGKAANKTVSGNEHKYSDPANIDLLKAAWVYVEPPQK